MAVTATHRTTASDNTDLSSYTTASFASTNGDLIIAFVGDFKVTAAPIPTLTSAHGTWVQGSTIARMQISTEIRITCFSCIANGSSGAVTIDMGGVTIGECQWSFTEFGNQNGIVQSASAVGSSTAPLATLAAFENSANATIGGVYVNPQIPTVGSGFTQLGAAGFNGFINAEWNVGNDTTVDWSTLSAPWHVIALELREASVPVPTGGFFAIL